MSQHPAKGSFMRILPSTAITTALTANVAATNTVRIPDQVRSLAVLFNFDYGSSGTSLTAYLQTSFDGGSNWVDIAVWDGTTSDELRMYNLQKGTSVTSIYTPTDGTLADDTSKDGLIGDRLRVKLTSVGTYADTTLTVTAVAGL